jgi:triphosphoribosyl-dephospho-CoA synthetase
MRTNSTSNTKKIKQIIKKRMEKGNRALNLGINPHSKGLAFSREKCFFLPTPVPRKNTKVTIKQIATLIKSIKNIGKDC